MPVSGIKLATRPSPAHNNIRTIAVISGKGGAGKTTIATNLSLALAASGQRTMLLDADLGMANADILLGLHPDYTLLDVINGQHHLKDILVNGPHNLMLIPAASGRRELATLDGTTCTGLVRAFSELADELDTLVVDTESGISDSITTFARAAHDVLVVTGEEPASLRDNAALVRHLHAEQGITRFQLLVNMVENAPAGEMACKAFRRALDDLHEVTISYAGFVPQDPAVRRAAMAHKPVIESLPRSRAAMAIANLAHRASLWPLARVAGGHMEFFVERLVNHNNVEMEVKS
jgi:flagellar biosynthesis protein FlhG